jgi:oligoendopeptidase F
MADKNNLDFDEMPADQFDQEIQRIVAAKRVLKRYNLDIFDQLRTEDEVAAHQSVLALWQNEAFQMELDQAILAELAPDPGGVRRFLADFETRIEDLEARWRIMLYWQGSSTRVMDFEPLIAEHQEIFTKDLLQRLENMEQIPDVDLSTRRCLGLLRQVAECELVDSALASQRTNLRQNIANYRFQRQDREFTASQITTMILREEQDRQLRQQAWNNLIQFSQQMTPKMRELMLQTNAYWQERGYTNANAPRLQVLGVSEAVVRQVIASIEATTLPTAQTLLEEYEILLGHKIAPWDWRFAATQLPRSFDQTFKSIDAIHCLKKTYLTLGIDIEKLPIMFAGSSAVHGVSYNTVRVPHDIILSHGPISSAREYFALLHALGEACYWGHIDGDLPYVFRRYASEVLAEGFAILSSWLLWEYDWLQEFGTLTLEEIVEFSQQMKNYELLKLRYSAGFALFELDAYRVLADDSDADLDTLYRYHMESFLLVPHDGQSPWAVTPWLINLQSIPLFANYVLGLAIAATLMEYLREKGNSIFSEEFGKLFQSDLVYQGGSSPWLELLQKQTAKTLIPFPMSWSQV